MKKQILVDNETMDFLLKTFGCTRMAVWYALNFERNSEKAIKMRYLALQRGGKLVGAKMEPETSFGSDGVMTQTFGTRIKLTANKGQVTVWVDGKVTEEQFCKEIPDFVALQDRVREIATKLYAR